MLVTLDLMTLLYAVLSIAGVVLLVYLIIVMARLSKTLTKVNLLLDQIREPVAATTKQLPELVGKIDRISAHVETVADAAKTTIPPVLNDIKTVTSNVRESVTNVGDTVQDVSEGLHGFFSGAQGAAGNIGSIVSIISTVFDVINHLLPSKPKSNRRKK